MPYTTKSIFLKCWLWSVICGGIIALIFWLFSDFSNLFHRSNGDTIFTDILLGLSVIGSYIGAGYVGWRIADKYYPSVVEKFLKRYRFYSFLSILALVAVIYSPLSILALFWSVLAPYCVVVAISKSKKVAH